MLSIVLLSWLSLLLANTPSVQWSWTDNDSRSTDTTSRLSHGLRVRTCIL